MKIKNVKVYGLEGSLMRSGYPMQTGEPEDLDDLVETWQPEMDDLKHVERAKRLSNTPSGSGHSNFRKGIIVQFDILYPQYLFSQFDRYNFWDDIGDGIFPKTTDLIDIISSQSKMHKLTSVKDIKNNCNKYVLEKTADITNDLIAAYNFNSYPVDIEYRINENNEDVVITANDKQELFQYIISNLPMGYELWMGVSTNYEQLATIYRQRKNHKLKHDWGYFCRWIETLPMSELITGKNE